MRRWLSVVCAVLGAAVVVSFSTISAEAQTADQYEPSDGSEASQETQESPAPEETPSGASPSEASSSGEDPVSRGTATDVNGPGAVAARADIAVEEKLPGYSQVVDNTTKGRFQAPGWQLRRASLSHGGSFVASGEEAGPARFRVTIPTTNDYSVYAWWPQAESNGLASRFSIQTADGAKSDEVNQRTEGGVWIRIGSYAMQKGERYVQVAPGEGGQAAADAVMVLRGEATMPAEDTAVSPAAAAPSPATGTRPPVGRAAAPTGERSTATDSRARTTVPGWSIVRQARRHEFDRYRYATCTATLKSCTCLTKAAVAPFGHRMDMSEAGQWNYRGSFQVAKTAIRPGDEVFFKESGPRAGITHVGIYSGNGNIVHASSYYGRVIEGKHMRYLKGFSGAKRFRAR